MASIGMNLAPVAYWLNEEPFIDRFKTSGVWTLSTGQPATLDADGNPVSLPSDASYIGITFSVDTVGASTSDEYVLTYDGTAKLSLLGVTIVSSTPGKIVFDVTAADKSSVFLKLTSMDGSDPISDIHVVRSDQIDLYNSGEIFNPAFVEKVAQWGMVRFMDWGNTNASAAVSWDTRSTMADSSWATADHADGVPLEVMVKLANEAHTDMWYNVPTQADDTYVTNALAYIKANLDPDLKVHVEYSNEVWNAGFAASKYARAQANALWGVDANHDGTIDPNDPAEAVAHGNLVYYGYRSAQIASIAQTVFGSDASDRLVTVLSGQATNVAGAAYELQGISLANVGTTSSLFDDYAVTTYFGSQLNSTNAADVKIVLGWAESGAAGLDAAFNELANGGTLSKDFSLAAMGKYFAADEAFAEKNGLNMVAYEGGASLVSGGFSADIRAELTTFFGELMNDPRMGDLYTQMVNSFTAAGGDALVAFDDVGANSQYGYWGVLNDIYDTSSARYDALVAAANASAAKSGEIVGTAGDDHLTGGSGDDVMSGGDGNDYLNGALGADQMIGGNGNDTYIVDNVGDVVIEAANGGIDEVRTTLSSYTLDPNVENLTALGTDLFVGVGNELDNVITAGTGGSRLYGAEGNDTLIGGAGADYLDGGSGADKMTGGAGNDIYIVDDAGDVVVEAANGGTDEVRTTLASYTLGANVENLTALGTAAFTGTGNTLANVLTAGAGAATLYGGAGNDTLIGGAGNDYLDGGTGADTMAGGAGNDIYIVDNAGDVVTEAANGGTDEVRTTLASYTLTANVENLTALGTTAFTGTGNALDNVITAGTGNATLYGGDGNDTLLGGAGNDYLDGGTGADTMIGGAGNDIYIVDNVGDVVVEAANGGTDEVRTTLASYTLGANVETLRSLGTGAFVGIGNELANKLVAGPGDSMLYGGDGNDTLLGGAGNDYLDGGTGADQMTGGAGNDVYIVDNAGDYVSELAGGGIDEVRTTLASYNLTPNVENLTFTGTGAFTGTGNSLDNVIVGGSGDDTLNGGDGNDTLIGGAGNDALHGGAGNDIMIGGTGDDTYWVSDLGDTIVENANEGYDLVYASVSFRLPANVEELIVVGAGNEFWANNQGDKITGASGNDRIHGGLGADTLLGGGGNDVLYGGGGQDLLTGGTGADTFTFGPGDLVTDVTQTARITDFNRADGDKIDLSGIDAIAATKADDAFSFIGTAAFTKHAGELRAVKDGTNYDIFGDTNGDGIADFSLVVTSKSGMLAASDFLL